MFADHGFDKLLTIKYQMVDLSTIHLLICVNGNAWRRIKLKSVSLPTLCLHYTVLMELTVYIIVNVYCCLLLKVSQYI